MICPCLRTGRSHVTVALQLTQCRSGWKTVKEKSGLYGRKALMQVKKRRRSFQWSGALPCQHLILHAQTMHEGSGVKLHLFLLKTQQTEPAQTIVCAAVVFRPSSPGSGCLLHPHVSLHVLTQMLPSLSLKTVHKEEATMSPGH